MVRIHDAHQEPKVGRNLVAVWILIFANIAITINQGNIASSYFQIAQDFQRDIVGLGSLTSSFFLAYALFVVPGGFVAARIGPKRVIMIGTAINAASVVMSSFSPTFNDLLILRFLSGVGSAFAWPSILVLIVRYYSISKAGFGVGLMSLSSAVGNVLASFGWAVFSDVSGWRFSILIGGLVDIASLGAMVLLVPRDRVSRGPRFGLRKIVTNKLLAIMSVVSFGLAAAFGLSANLMIYYMESNFGTSPGIAGGIVAAGLAIPIMTSPLIGRVYDNIKNRKALLLATSLAETISLSATSIGSFYSAIFTSLTAYPVGSGGMIIAYNTARTASSGSPEYESLSVAWVDSFCLFGTSAAPIYFTFIGGKLGYSSAWLLGGVIASLLALPILFVKKENFNSGKNNVAHEE